MAKGKITKRSVDAIQPAHADMFLWDTELPGFGLKVTPKGRKVYIVQYQRSRSVPSQRVTVGTHGTLAPEKAREQAKELLAHVQLGKDPAAERRRKRQERTIAELCDRYLREHVVAHNKPSTESEVRRIVEHRIKPALGRVKISELTRARVKEWHQDKAETPYAANRELAYLSKMMSLAAGDWELRPDNPCRGIRKFPERKREAFFSDADLQRIGAALAAVERENGAMPGPINAIRLLAVTGMRLGEVLALRWDYLDEAHACLRLPDAKAGARTVPLSAPALALLSNIERTGEYVCHGTDPKQPLDKSTVHKLWRSIKATAKVPNGRPHDFRHTVGTFAAQAGMNAFLVRDLLGHKTMAMTGRYVERANDTLRQAADLVAGRVAAALSGNNAEIVAHPAAQTKRQL